MFHRERPEKEYAYVLFFSACATTNIYVHDRPLYKNYGYGTTVWSPLASGMLTGKVSRHKHYSHTHAKDRE